MILSKVIRNNKKIYTSKLIKLIEVLNRLKRSKKTLKNLSNSVKTQKFTFSVNNKNFQTVKQNVINYVINIILSPTNNIINVTDVKGNVIVSISAGKLKLTKFQKRSQPMALLSMFKVLLPKAKFLQNKVVSLHFKNVKRFHESFFVTALKKKIFVKSFQSYNLTPHNGCRPKKIKRIKRRTKRRVLK